jgi:hypothetical protein
MPRCPICGEEHPEDEMIGESIGRKLNTSNYIDSKLRPNNLDDTTLNSLSMDLSESIPGFSC